MCFGCTRERAALFFPHLTASKGGFGSHQIGCTFHDLDTVLPVPVQFVTRRAGTLITAQSVHASEFTATPINAALINISTVSNAIEDVTFVAVALETSR